MTITVLSDVDGTVTYEHSEELKQKVFDRVMEYFKEHQAFIGEVIYQSDECNIDAPSVMAEIVDDIIHFECHDL